MVKRVFAWQTDTAGCFYYRIYLPLTNLSKTEWDIHWGEPGTDIHDYDVVIGQRIAGKNDLWLDICRDDNVLAVYDLDDDLLNIDPTNTVPYNIYAPIAVDTAKNIMAADVVTVSTPKLGAFIAEINPNVIVLENCVTEELTQRVRPVPSRFTVGWAGSMFHEQDWAGIPQVLANFYAAVPHVDFHAIGANYTRGLIPTRFTPWNTIDHYYASLDFDIGIAPLTLSTFNEHKSWIKLLEYAALGIPAIASNVGQYPEFISHGINGYLVKSHNDWINFLRALTDDVLRATMSEAARYVAKKYTIEKQVHRWAEAYSGR